jgi:hypothetical protein
MFQGTVNKGLKYTDLVVFLTQNIYVHNTSLKGL